MTLSNLNNIATIRHELWCHLKLRPPPLEGYEVDWMLVLDRQLQDRSCRRVLNTDNGEDEHRVAAYTWYREPQGHSVKVR